MNSGEMMGSVSPPLLFEYARRQGQDPATRRRVSAETRAAFHHSERRAMALGVTGAGPAKKTGKGLLASTSQSSAVFDTASGIGHILGR